MKALTLRQPWASLVSLGVKQIETRSWTTSHRGPLAIHAGSQVVHHGNRYLLARRARMAKLITAEEESEIRANLIPYGAVVATCELVDVVSSDDINWCTVYPRGYECVEGRWCQPQMSNGTYVKDDQRAYGDFSPGRFAWLLSDIKPLAEPIPAKGRRRLWEWESP